LSTKGNTCTLFNAQVRAKVKNKLRGLGAKSWGGALKDTEGKGKNSSPSQSHKLHRTPRYRDSKKQGYSHVWGEKRVRSKGGPGYGDGVFRKGTAHEIDKGGGDLMGDAPIKDSTYSNKNLREEGTLKNELIGREC